MPVETLGADQTHRGKRHFGLRASDRARGQNCVHRESIDAD
jgi:hypothetical protein